MPFDDAFIHYSYCSNIRGTFQEGIVKNALFIKRDTARTSD